MGQNLNDAVQQALADWDAERSTDRLWSRNASLWPAGAASWLGWLDVATPQRATLDDIMRRASNVAPDATEVLLIGMGGSSLAPEVIARTLPRGANGRTIRVLDSTEPSFIRTTFAQTNWARTIILVASKSGSTLEPDILFSAAHAAAHETLGDAAGRQCIAITDPGSKLEKQARALNFAEVFLGDPSIGGRFSALSPFGLVPAALHGVDLTAFGDAARDMAMRCHAPAGENPGVQLGVYLATAAKAGRDKCSLVLPPSLASMGAWIEQLIAESTGKNGMAIVPIDGEVLGEPNLYGADRAFVHVRDASAPDANDARVEMLRSAGHPVFTIDVSSPSALAAEFFRWEFATAVAGSVLGLNPFDQPDVEAAKVATRQLTDEYERGYTYPVAGGDSGNDLATLLDSIRPGDYFAILAFLPMFPEVRDALDRIRSHVRKAKRVATSVGFGPRFLHSTGQAFKGGPNTGVFLQLTCSVQEDVPIPGRKLTFGAVVSAQAAGDRTVLRERGRRLVHMHLQGDLRVAIGKIETAVETALGA